MVGNVTTVNENIVKEHEDKLSQEGM